MDVHVQCLVERVLHVWMFMSSVWLKCSSCVDVHVQCLVERVLHVWMFMSSVWLNVFFMCGCSCPVFG